MIQDFQDNSVLAEGVENLSGWITLLFVRLLIKWFRFHSLFGLTLTAFLWIFLCYQVLSRSGSLNEDDSFNLIEDVLIDDIKEVHIQSVSSAYIRFQFYEVNLWIKTIAYHRLDIELCSSPLLSKKKKIRGFQKW